MRGALTGGMGQGFGNAVAATVTLGAVFALYKCGAGYVLVA